MNLSRSVALAEGWQLARAPAGAFETPDKLGGAALQWRGAAVPGTVGSALEASLDVPADYDDADWWYRTTFAAPGSAGARQYLRFDGLATLAQVWLNGQPLLDSRSMFVGHRVEVTALLRDVNHLAIRFESLGAAMARKRPRPRWHTQLVEQQNLRWFRTTLLGRMPGWTPMVPIVGPWGAVSLECVDTIDVHSLNIQARAAGSEGRVLVRAAVSRVDGKLLEGARLRIGDSLHELKLLQAHDARIHGDIALEAVPLWWPHTHGQPRRLRCVLELLADGRWLPVDCGLIGFKEIALDQRDGRLAFLVNGSPVFCRGAVWTTMDIRSLRAEPAALRRALEAARDAGLNMIRVGGTMHYERDEFYDLCDELGILVWQDFMFANMDYPVADAQFRADAEAEARWQLERLHRHPCIAAWCGGSEVAQQAAMMGLPADQWTNDFFTETLPGLCASEHGGIPYFPSTPWGGALPFHVSSGVSHYYGVGAYRRPLADAKTARVKFTTECLGFSNVPEPHTAEMVQGSPAPPTHHPKWKARVPRDPGAGWDFEDVRDHYLAQLFDCDPVALRSQDLERYHRLSRVATGEVMRSVFAEWRAPHNACGGALVWNFRDLWPGAGWGLVDSEGRFKPAMWYLKRAWAKRGVYLTDEGLDGLAIHLVNDTPHTLDASVEIEMYRDGRVPTASARATLLVPARGSTSRYADGLLGYFTDSTNAYRFGPPKNDVVVARLRGNDTNEVIAEDFYFPLGLRFAPLRGAAVNAHAVPAAGGKVALTIRSDSFLQSVSLACDGFLPDDNYFHVAPGVEKRVLLTPQREGAAFRGWLEALNLPDPVALRLQQPAANAEMERQPFR